MNNDELLKKIGEFINPVVNGISHLKTAVESLKAGQDDLLERVVLLEEGQKEIRATMATKEDIKDMVTKQDIKDMATRQDIKRLERKLDIKLQDHEERIQHVEYPHKN